MKLPNKVYDVLKYICLIVIPAAVVLIATCGHLWGLDDETIKIVTGSLTGLATAVGATLGFSSAEYYKDKEETEPEKPSGPKTPVATIYLSPSQQSGNKYAISGTNEKEQCEKIAQACQGALIDHGFKVYLEPNRDVTLRVLDANRYGDVDWYIPIHTNAFDGKVSGTRLMIRNFGGVEEECAKAIFNRLDACCPGTSSNITARGDKWYEQRLTVPIPSVYIEADFHDVPEVAKFIIEHTVEIGESIARGICDYYHIDW